MKGIDAYITGGGYHEWTDTIDCRFGHTWEIFGSTEYGADYPFDEDNWMRCRACGRYAKEFLRQELEYRKEARQIRKMKAQL